MEHRSAARGAITAVLILLAAAASAGADGLIVVSDHGRLPDGHFPFAPLEVTFHRVSVAIQGAVAVTTVDQEFFNPRDARLEGTYIFPLPEGAHIDRFTMDVNGSPRDAELLPADKARALYEEIVRKMRDPALLEYAGRGAFKVRIFPIEPRSSKRIRITYTELLRNDGGLFQYVYPLNTEKFSAAPIRQVSVKVTLEGAEPLKSVYCPTHDAEVRRDGARRAVVGWEASGDRPDRDFKVIFSRAEGPIGMNIITSRAAGEDGYFLLLASAGALPANASAMPKDVTFVLDTSGSMADGKLDQARRALRYCLETLNAGDRFEIIRFATDTEHLFGALLPASTENRDRARGFIDGLRAAGGTAIQDALGEALALRKEGGSGGSGGAPRPCYVVFMTDGLPTIGETREDPLVDGVRAAARGARLFTFGIGTDVNAHLLDRISAESRGASQYVLAGEDIEVALSAFAAKVREPVLADLALSTSNASVHITGMYPARLPDLFAGEMLTVFGRYSGSGTAVVKITGTVNGERRQYSAEARFPEREPDNPFVPRLWAVRRVGWLLDEMRMHGESTELVTEVVALARRFGIITPYTAFMVMEDEERRAVPQALRSFQELEDDAAVRGAAEKRLDSVKREAASESSRSGKAAVDNAMALRDLKDSWNEAQAAPAAGFAKAPAGGGGPTALPRGFRAQQAANYASQVRILAGRAFYLNAGVWTDSTAQAKNARQVKVRFGSKEYFSLAAADSAAVQWLSLGNNVDLVIDGTLYSVRDE
jgi:Ca-activated chloride channel homolog